MKSAEQRKAESIEKLKQWQIPYIDWLPVIETADQVRIRTAEEIAQRAISCLIVIQSAFELHTDNYTPEIAHWVMDMLAKYDLHQTLTPNEVTLLNRQGTEQDIINMIWKYEAYWTLLWALGMVETLDFPSDTIDCDFAIQAVSECENFDEFMARTKLRDIEEILDEADLIYRLDWACVNARLKNEPAPTNMNSSVVVERHKGLNWLIDNDGSDDWDNPDVST